MLSKNDLAAFNQHLSSVIPLLLSLAEGQGGRCGGGGGSGVRQASGGKGGTAQSPGTGGDAMSRFRAVQCLTALTALPYSRLHPFKTQVTFYFFVLRVMAGGDYVRQFFVFVFRTQI